LQEPGLTEVLVLQKTASKDKISTPDPIVNFDYAKLCVAKRAGKGFMVSLFQEIGRKKHFWKTNLEKVRTLYSQLQVLPTFDKKCLNIMSPKFL